MAQLYSISLAALLFLPDSIVHHSRSIIVMLPV